jgi:hypothetical protein
VLATQLSAGLGQVPPHTPAVFWPQSHTR